MSPAIALSLFAYLGLAVAVAALLLWPELRQLVAARLAGLMGTARRVVKQARLPRLGAGARHLPQPLVLWRSAIHLNRQQWLMGMAALLLVALPVTTALLLRRAQPLQGFEERSVDTDSVIASLLVGEALVPPPPLPPEIFVTREVELQRPDLGSASREWALLDEEFRQRLLVVYRSLAMQGYTLALLEGYRSPQRQAMLQARGTSVTNAGAYQSYHQFGLAADSAFYRDGRLVITERDPWAMRGYQLLGEAAEAQGLRWGGRWQLQDYGHVELRRPGVLGTR